MARLRSDQVVHQSATESPVRTSAAVSDYGGMQICNPGTIFRNQWRSNNIAVPSFVLADATTLSTRLPYKNYIARVCKEPGAGHSGSCDMYFDRLAVASCSIV
jgi:hypothetical protein